MCLQGLPWDGDLISRLPGIFPDHKIHLWPILLPSGPKQICLVTLPL